jgi:hypothetical protein
MDSHHRLARHGDEWIAAYACIPVQAFSPVLFSIGHAVELYLKAAHTKIFGDLDAAIRHGHKIRNLWNECRRRDREFMKKYQFREHLFNMDLLDGSIFERCSPDDQTHYMRYQGLYMVFKHVQDLKYLGLPWKSRQTGDYALAFGHPDDVYVPFFRGLRRYLSYPPPNGADRLQQIVETQTLPVTAQHYLREFYENPATSA